MVAALADIKVTLRQLHPGRDVQILLQEIEDLGGNRFGKAQAASLGGFCEKAVRGLEAFLVNLTALKVFRIGRGPEELKRALGSAALYLNEKCTIWGAARLWAVEAAGGRSFVATETDARNRITEAVRLHVEVVVEAAKVTPTTICIFTEDRRKRARNIWSDGVCVSAKILGRLPRRRCLL